MSAGPAPGRCASPAAAVPIVAKMPAPMIAPMPSATRFHGPSAFLSWCPSSCVSASRSSSDFVRNSSRMLMSARMINERGAWSRERGEQLPAPCSPLPAPSSPLIYNRPPTLEAHMSAIEQPLTMKYPPVQNYIGGEFVPGSAREELDVTNPADGSVISRVPLSAAGDVDRAVEAAKGAFPGWSGMPIKERVQVFFRYKTLLEKNIDSLARLVTEENGK